MLGQSRKLRKQTGVPVDEDHAERRRVVENLKATAGVVIMYRRLFKTFFLAAAKHTGRADLLPPPHRAQMLAAMSSDILCWGVSDSIFVAVPLAWTRHPAARAIDLFRSLLAAGSMWLAGLSTNNPIRGGMEVGTGIDIEPGEIYGQALEAAHHLESTVAKRPRIVVGPRCVEFLQEVERRGQASDANVRLAASCAKLCLSMLKTDADGVTVVDGLGETMMAQAEKVPDLREQFRRAHENVRAQYQRFRDTGDAKHASRYEALVAYFDERAPNWQGPSRRAATLGDGP